MKMTTEEAFVKVLQMHGIEHAFGIIGSAFMPISDNFPDHAELFATGQPALRRIYHMMNERLTRRTMPRRRPLQGSGGITKTVLAPWA